MMPQIVLLVVVGVIGVLAVSVPNPYHRDGDPEIRQGRHSEHAITNKDTKQSRRPGQYEIDATCGHGILCLSAKRRFAYPSSLDRHWAQWHEGQIPEYWVEPKTVPSSGRGSLPVGETTESLRWSEKINKKYPNEAQSIRDQREARKLFTGHMPVLDPAMKQAALDARKHASETERRKAKSLADKERYKRRQAAAQLFDTDSGSSMKQAALAAKKHARETERCKAKSLADKERYKRRPAAQLFDTDSGSSMQQAASSTTKECEVIQSPLTFTHSLFSPLRTATIQTQDNLCHHVPSLPPEQPHMQHLDIDLNYPPDQQHLDLRQRLARRGTAEASSIITVGGSS